MALRTVRQYPDEVLAKKCKEVKEVTPRIKELIRDMIETMHESNGIGLAAPQVGIQKRLFVVDVTGDDAFVCINPEFLSKEGEQTGKVTRADRVKIRAFNENMEPFELEAEGLLARCLQHENDHLDGIMYMEKMDGELIRNEELEEIYREEDDYYEEEE